VGLLGVYLSKAPTLVGRLKSKLKDVNVDSSTVLRTLLELSSLWVGPESLAFQISVPGTQAASWSMWAELSYNCGVSLDGDRPVLPPPDPTHHLLFRFLFPTLPAVENSHHKEPEVRAFWNPPWWTKPKEVDILVSPKETFFQ